MTLPPFATELGTSPVVDSNSTPVVSIVYVNWNCAEEIVASIASVREWTQDVSYEILVVDNDSPQGPGVLEHEPGICLIRSTVNGGFGAGCNLGARAAEGSYLLFLNPDTRLLNDAVSELYKFLQQHPSAAVAGPLVESQGGQVLLEGGRSLPNLYNEFLQHSTLCFRFPRHAWSSQPYLSTWDHLSTREVESVLGACMLIPAKLFREVGGFDERFFLYSEELDLCQRFRSAGYKIWYVHTARIMHKERQSTIQLFGSTHRIVLENLRSQRYYFRKHHGAAKTFLWRNLVAALYLARYLVHREKHHMVFFKWALTGR